MLPLLAILFIVVPLAELYVILQVGQTIGALETIGLLILISVVGAWLAKREGIGVIRRIQRSIEARRVPGTELIDGFLILLAGALMLTPGFLTDGLAILLLVPPARAVVRRQLRRVFARRIQIL